MHDWPPTSPQKQPVLLNMLKMIWEGNHKCLYLLLTVRHHPRVKSTPWVPSSVVNDQPPLQHFICQLLSAQHVFTKNIFYTFASWIMQNIGMSANSSPPEFQHGDTCPMLSEDTTAVPFRHIIVECNIVEVDIKCGVPLLLIKKNTKIILIAENDFHWAYSQHYGSLVSDLK